MAMMSNSEILEQKCVLCKEPAERNRPWDEVWDRKCKFSICKLLELDRKDFNFLFETRNYCSPCHEFIRDIDFTVRTLESLEEKSQELRSILSQMLLPKSEAPSDSETDENEVEHYWSVNNSEIEEPSDLSEEFCTPPHKSRIASPSNDPVIRIHKESLPTSNGHCKKQKFVYLAEDYERNNPITQIPTSRYIMAISNTSHNLNEKETNADTWDPKQCRNSSDLQLPKSSLHTDTGPVFVCPLCEREFSGKLILTNHIKWSHPSFEKFSCEICKYAFFFDEDCKAHEKLHQLNSYICILGQCYRNPSKVELQQYSSVDELRLHVQNAHEYRCEICRFKARNKFHLTVFKQEHPKNDEAHFPCKTCGKQFTTKITLLYHEGQKHPDYNNRKLYTCKLCSSTCYSSSELEYHRQIFHSRYSCTKLNPDSKKTGLFVTCPMCRVRYPGIPQLNVHIKLHHPNSFGPKCEEFWCNICEFSSVFFTKEGCAAHEILHKPNSYTCVLGKCYSKRFKVQPKDFVSLEGLREHVSEVHPNAYQCDTNMTHLKRKIIASTDDYSDSGAGAQHNCNKRIQNSLRFGI